MMNNPLTVQGDKEITFIINPEKLIADATRIATALTNIIKEQELFSVIEGRKYVHATGWGVLMAMRGINPFVTRCERLERINEIAYESEVELVGYDGRVVGRASAICSSREPHKDKQQEYAIKSMSQTRATSKAARLSFGWIIKLAGYEPTPAEEMTDVVIQKPTQKLTQKPTQQMIPKCGSSNINIAAHLIAQAQRVS